jgi:branched-chain amino acid transport system permease protein
VSRATAPPLGARAGGETRRRVRDRRVALAATLAVGTLAAASAPFLEVSLLSLAGTMLMYIVLAQGWNILGGYVGYLNLGTAAFVGVGGYTTGMLAHHLDWPPFAAVPVAGLVAISIALLLAGPTLRLRGAYFAIMTLIITFIVQSVVYNWPPTLGAVGIFFIPVTRDPRLNETIFFAIFLVLAVLTTVAVLLLEHSRLGDALRAVREDEDAAAVLGIDTVRLKMVAFVAGAGISGVVGGLAAYRLTYIEPAGMFDVALSVNVVVMVILGGAGSWIGPLIGAPAVLALAEAFRVLVTRVEFMGAPLPNELNRLALGAIIVVLALFAPRGIVGAFRRRRGRTLGV